MKSVHLLITLIVLVQIPKFGWGRTKTPILKSKVNHVLNDRHNEGLYFIKGDDLELGDLCVGGPLKKPGVCNTVKDCRRTMRGRKRGESHPTLCGFIETMAIVCCPVEGLGPRFG